MFVVRWRAGSPPQALRHDYEALLHAAPAHHAVRWLLDVRQRPLPSAELVSWITLRWLPQVAARFAPGELRLAYLVSASRTAELAADAEQQARLRHALAPNGHYQVAMFGDEAAARHWLLA